MAPSIEREMRNLLTERAEAEAVKIFAKNTESLLMAPPVKGKRVVKLYQLYTDRKDIPLEYYLQGRL